MRPPRRTLPLGPFRGKDGFRPSATVAPTGRPRRGLWALGATPPVFACGEALLLYFAPKAYRPRRARIADLPESWGFQLCVSEATCKPDCRVRVPLGAKSRRRRRPKAGAGGHRSEEHTSELQSLMRTSSAVFCL